MAGFFSALPDSLKLFTSDPVVPEGQRRTVVVDTFQTTDESSSEQDADGEERREYSLLDVPSLDAPVSGSTLTTSGTSNAWKRYEMPLLHGDVRIGRKIYPIISEDKPASMSTESLTTLDDLQGMKDYFVEASRKGTHTDEPHIRPNENIRLKRDVEHGQRKNKKPLQENAALRSENVPSPSHSVTPQTVVISFLVVCLAISAYIHIQQTNIIQKHEEFSATTTENLREENTRILKENEWLRAEISKANHAQSGKETTKKHEVDKPVNKEGTGNAGQQGFFDGIYYTTLRTVLIGVLSLMTMHIACTFVKEASPAAANDMDCTIYTTLFALLCYGVTSYSRGIDVVNGEIRFLLVVAFVFLQWAGKRDDVLYSRCCLVVIYQTVRVLAISKKVTMFVQDKLEFSQSSL